MRVDQQRDQYEENIKRGKQLLEQYENEMEMQSVEVTNVMEMNEKTDIELQYNQLLMKEYE